MIRRHSAAFYGFVGWLGNTRLITRAHPIAYRATGGRWFTGRNLGVLHVVLTTTGRLSGYAAEGAERDRLWRLVVQAYPGYELYQQRTRRQIPVVVLAPASRDEEPA